MKADFSRLTFDPKKHYSRVLLQQGRVLLDSDWNESVEILGYHDEMAIRDLVGPSGMPTDKPGFGIVIRSGLQFDGVDDYAYIGDRENLSIAHTRPFTIEAWIKPEATTHESVILSRFDIHGSQLRGEFSLGVQPDGHIVFKRVEVEREEVIARTEQADVSGREEIYKVNEFEVVDLRLRTVVSNTAVPFGQYSHVAVTFDGEAIRLFIDGLLVATSRSRSVGVRSETPLLIGAAHHNEKISNFFNGVISEIRMWHIARTREHIHADMYRAWHTKVPDLISHWTFHEHSGEYTRDMVHEHEGLLGKGVMSAMPKRVPADVWISKGRGYVDGILCESEQDVSFVQQPDWPGAKLPAHSADPYLVYLDVWQRLISDLEDPAIREPALGGTDTAVRVKTVWQVKILPLSEADYLYDTTNQGKLRARGTLPAVENRLYRIEIHESGALLGEPISANHPALAVKAVESEKSQITVADWGEKPHEWRTGSLVEIIPPETSGPGRVAQIKALDVEGKTLTLDTLPSDMSGAAHWRIRKVATYKWGRDNGCITFPIDRIEGNTLTLEAQDGFALDKDDWVEVLDDTLTLHNQVLPLRQITNVGMLSDGRLRITLSNDLTPDLTKGACRHPLLRRWDHGAEASKWGVGVASAGWLSLEDGIQVFFDGGRYQSSDFWLIPARHLVAKVDWPVDQDGESLAKPSMGIQHHYASLALLWLDDTPHIEDLRHLFAPLATAPTGKSGPLRTNGSLYVAEDAVIEGSLSVGTLYGTGIVGTEQLADGSVTPDKLASSVGQVRKHQAILSASEPPPAGYISTGTTISSANVSPIWEVIAELPRSGPNEMAAIGTKLYLLWDDGELWEFNTKTLGWNRKPNRPSGYRSEFGLGTLKGKLYVAGGLESDGAYSAHCEVYDPGQDKWSDIAPLPTPRSQLGLGTLGDRLYAIGGVKSGWFGLVQRQATGIMEIYHPDTDRWSRGKALLPARFAAGIGTFGGNLHILGGATNYLSLFGQPTKTNLHQAYSGRTHTWHSLPSLPVPTSHLHVGVINDKLYTLGGTRRDHLTASGEIFDFNSRTWLPDALPTQARRHIGVAVVDGSLYVAGGERSNGEIDRLERCEIARTFYVHLRTEG